MVGKHEPSSAPTIVATPFTIMVGNGGKRSPAAAALSTHCSVPMKFITASGATAERNGSTSGSPASTAPSEGCGR